MLRFKLFIESDIHLKFGNKLGQHADIGTNMSDADFWIIRKGDEKSVGKVTDEYSPEHIGVKNRNHKIDSNYLKYSLQHVHNQGYYKGLSIGTTRLKNIRVKHVSDIPIQSSEYSNIFKKNINENKIKDLYSHKLEDIKDIHGDIHVRHHKDNDGRHNYNVYHQGRKIASAKLSGQGHYVSDIKVQKEYRRKGISSKLYDFIENHSGKKLTPSPMYQTSDGKSFWKSRNKET